MAIYDPCYTLLDTSGIKHMCTLLHDTIQIFFSTTLKHIAQGDWHLKHAPYKATSQNTLHIPSNCMH